jgi:disulfide bond formation protein DsbB
MATQGGIVTRERLAYAAALGSLALLLGAFAFEYLGGLAPCALCIWQRWPHGLAVLAGVGVAVVPGPVMLALGAAGAAGSGGIGVYHTGVERGWWAGPDSCAGPGDITTLSADALLAQILEAPVVRCSDVPWEMWGLSMASWNAVLSFFLAGLWVAALVRRRPRSAA